MSVRTDAAGDGTPRLWPGRHGRRGAGPRRRLAALVVLLPLFASCGGQAAAPIARSTPSPTAVAAASIQAAASRTAVAAATANQADLVAFQTAQAARAATVTATPLPAATSTPVTSPTPAPVRTPSASAAPKAVATPGVPGAYVADFARWPTRTPEGTDPAKVTYSAAAGQYTMALTNAARPYVHWEYAPEGRAFGNFTLDVDARQIAGPVGGTYGALFRAQPQGPGDQTNAHYYLGIDPSAQEVFLIWTSADDQGHVLARATVPAVKQGDGMNHLHVQAAGDKITVAVNGVTVGTATGAATAPGAIGLIVVNPQHPTGQTGETASFSKLTVTRLP